MGVGVCVRVLGGVMITLILYIWEWWWGLGMGCDSDTQITHHKRGESKMLQHCFTSAFSFEPSGILQN